MKTTCLSPKDEHKLNMPQNCAPQNSYLYCTYKGDGEMMIFILKIIILFTSLSLKREAYGMRGRKTFLVKRKNTFGEDAFIEAAAKILLH
jgi:hypothetical protein